MLAMFANHPEQFEDLELYQDEDRDVKVSLRVDSDNLERFKVFVRGRGLSITKGIISLLLIYVKVADNKGEDHP